MSDDKKQPTETEAETDQELAAEIEQAEQMAQAEQPKKKRSRWRSEEPDEDDLVEALRAENKDLKDRYMRLAADMENLRKRTEREKADTAKFAISQFAREILTLSDNFQRAIGAVDQEAAAKDDALKSFLEGVEMNERELQRVLERNGVTKLDPKGEKFDPNMHQAVQQIDNKELPNNTVCDVYQVGYMIADRVLRHAVVAVAKGGPKLPPAEEAAPEAAAPAQEAADAPSEQAAENAPETSAEGEDVGATVDKNV